MASTQTTATWLAVALLAAIVVLLAVPDLLVDSGCRSSSSTSSTASTSLSRPEPHFVTATNIHSSSHANHALLSAMNATMEFLSAYAETALDPLQRNGFWASMGHIGQVPAEVADYARLAARPGVKTMCEIGFNAGHSSAALLMHNPGAVLYSFDIAENKYSKISLDLFRRAYPTRFHWLKGSSSDTVVWFQRLNITCDLFSVDGDHTYIGSRTDFINALKVMRVGSILVADDVADRFGGVKRAWQELIDSGFLKDTACNNNGPEAEVVNTEAGIKRWCWGTVVKVDGPVGNSTEYRGHNPNVFGSLMLDPVL